MKSPKLLFLLLLCVTLAACGRSEKAAAPAAGGAAAAPAVTSPAKQVASGGDPSAHVDRFQFGDATDANGVVVSETSVIRPGSTAALSLYLRNAPAGTQMRVVWNDMDKKAAVGEEVKAVGDKGFVTFQRAKPLPAGSYRVTMSFRPSPADKWEDLGSHDFKVGGKS